MKVEKNIYIVFSETKTTMGKLIRRLTHNKYNHVSISTDRELSVMYSFGRYHINSPLAGGFIVENPARYLIMGEDVNIKVCQLALDELSYARFQKKLMAFVEDKHTKIYNSFSAISSLFHKRINIEDAYTCLDFTTSMLDIDGVYNIKELEYKLNRNVIYEGSFKEYIEEVLSPEDDFFRKQNALTVVLSTLGHFRKLFIRYIRY
ncbi:hypothetical protein ACPWSR_02395 [Alloiococcus sp. CFN-8]|uniref:hypothetical protein n=1 Tax=Alloiococcus sp. CFN-8 TaxID=3416081 RepID=UPI003CF1BEE0